ncbi:MAG: transglycosylase domain-containing protein [Candidatus Caccovivens sp.]
MKKFVKICLISVVLLVTFAVVFSGTYLAINYIKFQSIPLNAEALTNPALSIDIFSIENKQIEEENLFNGDYCKLEDLQPYTKEAFLSIEDKEFYHHNGINKKRIVKAMLNNIKSMSLKEGASTISQQLIKNTHLTNEKTFERKLKEIALTQKLEKSFSKDEILESYLNIIFFGNNCYGLESASKFYFDKSAKDLTLSESCTLAGIIKSPSKYSPLSNYDNCLARRNLVLREMERDGYITAEEKLSAQNQPITLSTSKKTANKTNSYSQASIDEACKILNMPAKQIALAGYKIHTYMNEEKQQSLQNALSNNKFEDLDSAGIVIDAKTHGVLAYLGDSAYKLSEIKRQPGSCLKPILVYAPALNENVVSPATQVLDEKIKIGNFEPSNVNKKFAGYMSVTDAVKNSVNIPAIKVLSYIGIDTGKQYAEKLGINFDEKDNSFALALGGMTYGVTLKDLATSYTAFANNGNFAQSSFIQYITDANGKLVYVHKPQEQMVFREDSAYLMTNILQETAKSGTARKLSNLSNTEIASKTGTVGKKNGNTDAYNISYTPTEVIGVWFGDLSNAPSKIAGGNQPTEVVKQYISSQTYEKTDFDIPSSVAEARIDSLAKADDHRIVLASPYCPERYTETAIFSRFNMPSEMSSNFAEKPEINAYCMVKNNQIVVNLNAKKHIIYHIFKDNIPYQTIEDKEGELTLRLPLLESESVVKIVASYQSCDDFESEKTFTLSKGTSAQSSPKEKWYI